MLIITAPKGRVYPLGQFFISRLVEWCKRGGNRRGNGTIIRVNNEDYAYSYGAVCNIFNFRGFTVVKKVIDYRLIILGVGVFIAGMLLVWFWCRR